MKEITEIASQGQGLKHSEVRRCIYLAKHKIKQWWEQDIGAIAEVVHTSSSATHTSVSPKAEASLGDALAHFLPSVSLGLDLSLEKESITSHEVTLNLSPHIKAWILEQHRLKEGSKTFLTDWVTAKAMHRFRWLGRSQVTRLAPGDTSSEILVSKTHGRKFAFIGSPNRLPALIDDPPVVQSLEEKLKHYGEDYPFLMWFEQPPRGALAIMDKSHVQGSDPSEYVGDLHRYMSLPEKRVVFVGEALDWVNNVRFLNPIAIWLLAG